MSAVRCAVVQLPPVFGDRAASIARAVEAIGKAAADGARMVILPEAFVPGYPAWIWRLRPGTDMSQTERLHAQLREQAVRIEDGDLAPLAEAVRSHEVTVVCGICELDTSFSRGTIYNAVVVFGPDGTVLNRHRKLMPTNPERMVWGCGDASGLRVVPTPAGRLATLICWENYMPLARAALYAQGVEILVAPTYDAGAVWIASMQHVAREGGCWVLGCGNALRGRDIAEPLPAVAQLFAESDTWINAGDSVIVAPGGKIVQGPLHEAFGMLFAEVDADRCGVARRSLDVAGHYARPDVFKLHVDARPQPPVEIQRVE